MRAYRAGLLVGGLVVCTACKRLSREVDGAQTQVAQLTQEMAEDPESSLSDAGNGRFRERRQAVPAMRAALRAWAVAESAFLADSGHPGDVPLPFDVTLMKGDRPALFRGPWYWGPGAWVSVERDDITCWVYVGADTTISQRPSGRPDCAASRAVPTPLRKVLGLEPPAPQHAR